MQTGIIACEVTSRTPMKAEHIMFRVPRVLALCGVGVWGWYISAMFRTSGWGYDNFVREVLASLGTFCFFALPLTFIPLIGISWRRKLVAIAVLTTLCMFSVEVFARSQEYLLLRKLGKQPTKDYYETRWWPFEHHDIGFVQGQGWGCD